MEWVQERRTDNNERKGTKHYTKSPKDWVTRTTLKAGMNSCAPEGLTIALVALVVLI
jgi:hypothetical protein